jgi:hypothetical protein
MAAQSYEVCRRKRALAFLPLDAPSAREGDKRTKTTPEQNKTLVLQAFDTLFSKRDYNAAERYWSSHYIQHCAHIDPGCDGLFKRTRMHAERLPAAAGSRIGGDLDGRNRGERELRLLVKTTESTSDLPPQG